MENNDLYYSDPESIGIPKESVIHSSTIPLYIKMGNYIFEKQYNEAINLGLDLLKRCPPDNYEYLNMIHVNFMQLYFKIRHLNPQYFDLSTYHARQSMLYGHNTGYVQERLIINLEKSNKIYQALQVCDIIISDGFNFGNKVDFLKRKEKLLKKVQNSADSPDSKIFNEHELNILFKIHDEKNRGIPNILLAQMNDSYIGYKIHQSNNYDTTCDICEKLAGLHPKNFKWTKWHDGCKCYVSTEMPSEEDFLKYLKTGIKDYKKPVEVLPRQFMDWLKENIQKMKEMNKYPDFIKNNVNLINKS